MREGVVLAEVFFDTVLGNRIWVSDSNMMCGWRWRTLAQRGDWMKCLRGSLAYGLELRVQEGGGRKRGQGWRDAGTAAPPVPGASQPDGPALWVGRERPCLLILIQRTI